MRHTRPWKACRNVIDELKPFVPIGKEVYDDGEA
jgi:molybdopterin synthase catalytic subunit